MKHKKQKKNKKNPTTTKNLAGIKIQHKIRLLLHSWQGQIDDLILQNREIDVTVCRNVIIYR